MGAEAIVLLIIVIALIFLGVGLGVIGLVEEDSDVVPYIIIIGFFATICLAAISDVVERTGTVYSVETVQTGYAHEIVDGEIKQVPVYSYLILFTDEDGRYRTINTKDINYGLLKEGDTIIYKNENTKEVGE